jgi:L-amino acid N-acyltransferase YncA
MSATLRLATPDDIPAIHRIYSHAVINGTASWEWEPPSADEMLRRMTAICDGGYPWIVATSEEAVLGYAYAGAYRPRAAYRWTCEDSIYIAPEAQGQGLGRLLLTDLVSRCTSLGFRQMVAVIGDANSTPSVRLHTAMGFAPAGLIRNAGFKHGRWLDQVLMQRELGDGCMSLPQQNDPAG